MRRRARWLRSILDAELQDFDHFLDDRVTEVGDMSLAGQMLDGAMEPQQDAVQSERDQQLAESRAPRGISRLDGSGSQ